MGIGGLFKKENDLSRNRPGCLVLWTGMNGLFLFFGVLHPNPQGTIIPSLTLDKASEISYNIKYRISNIREKNRIISHARTCQPFFLCHQLQANMEGQ
jgi:hypothetical protein